ncbi:hypothetical protein SNEBB_005451 [Seison nebaliae]|nr:hypothetical protein SNEBB_005451 [Seison nebaliae]
MVRDREIDIFYDTLPTNVIKLAIRNFITKGAYINLCCWERFLDLTRLVLHIFSLNSWTFINFSHMKSLTYLEIQFTTSLDEVGLMLHAETFNETPKLKVAHFKGSKRYLLQTRLMQRFEIIRLIFHMQPFINMHYIIAAYRINEQNFKLMKTSQWSCADSSFQVSLENIYVHCLPSQNRIVIIKSSRGESFQDDFLVDIYLSNSESSISFGLETLNPKKLQKMNSNFLRACDTKKIGKSSMVIEHQTLGFGAPIQLHDTFEDYTFENLSMFTLRPYEHRSLYPVYDNIPNHQNFFTVRTHHDPQQHSVFWSIVVSVIKYMFAVSLFLTLVFGILVFVFRDRLVNPRQERSEEDLYSQPLQLNEFIERMDSVNPPLPFKPSRVTFENKSDSLATSGLIPRNFETGTLPTTGPSTSTVGPGDKNFNNANRLSNIVDKQLEQFARELRDNLSYASTSNLGTLESIRHEKRRMMFESFYTQESK